MSSYGCMRQLGPYYRKGSPSVEHSGICSGARVKPSIAAISSSGHGSPAHAAGHPSPIYGSAGGTPITAPTVSIDPGCPTSFDKSSRYNQVYYFITLLSRVLFQETHYDPG